LLEVFKKSGDVAGPRKGEPATFWAMLAAGQFAIAGLTLYLAPDCKKTIS